jgi:2-keto-4-pentenoate hydratase/2-oxohepta-3-ene-1,7-dioic acid hydratase in catechol pathway
MKLVTIDSFPATCTGALVEDSVLNFARAASVIPIASWIPTSMPALLAGGQQGLDIVRRVLDTVRENRSDEIARLARCGAITPRAQTRLDAPVRPGLVLSHGRAYFSHLKEMQKSDKPKVEPEPHAFMKTVNAIVGPDDPIVLPKQFPDMVDFEGEFSVVFGIDCHNVTQDEAMKYVAGYTIINDVSARNWVENFNTTGDPDLNRMGKQLRSFCPIGPVIVTRDEIPDPHDLTLTTTLNGKVMQKAHTSDLIYKIGYLIAFFARWYPFKPGDILTTGSPAGVGYGHNPKVFMKAGDTVAIDVTGVGTLSNRIVEEGA